MRTPDVELLWWDGCPSAERALEELGAALRDVGLDRSGVRVTEIRTDDEARAASFLGSPTILVDGADVAPSDGDERIGLSCRVYRRRDGTVSPTPDPDDLRDVLSERMGT